MSKENVLDAVARAMHGSHVARRKKLNREPPNEWAGLSDEMREDYRCAAGAGLRAYEEALALVDVDVHTIEEARARIQRLQIALACVAERQDVKDLGPDDLYTDHEKYNLQYALACLPDEGQSPVSAIITNMATQRKELQARANELPGLTAALDESRFDYERMRTIALAERTPGTMPAVLAAVHLLCGELPLWLGDSEQWTQPEIKRPADGVPTRIEVAVRELVSWLDDAGPLPKVLTQPRQNDALKIAFERLGKSLAFGAPEMHGRFILRCFEEVMAEYRLLYERTKAAGESAGASRERADAIAAANETASMHRAEGANGDAETLEAFSDQLEAGRHEGAAQRAKAVENV